MSASDSAVAEPLNEARRPSRGEILAIMRRPQSVLLLVLALAFAVGFSLLGQWQLGRAFENGAVIESESEHPLEIGSVVQPQAQTPSDAVGQLLKADGAWQPDDFDVLRDRLNDGASGYWVIGHFVTSDGDSLAVALGWASERAQAEESAETFAAEPEVLPRSIEGRYQQSEQPDPRDDAAPGEEAEDLAVPVLVNQWQNGTPVYAGYLTLGEAPDGLTTIYSPTPERQVQLNFLNLFYTLEWALFALIALYVWYRHMKDVAERELEQAGADDSPREAEPLS